MSTLHHYTCVLSDDLIVEPAKKYDKLTILYHIHNIALLLHCNGYFGRNNFLTTDIYLEILKIHPFLDVYPARAQTAFR